MGKLFSNKTPNWFFDFRVKTFSKSPVIFVVCCLFYCFPYQLFRKLHCIIQHLLSPFYPYHPSIRLSVRSAAAFRIFSDTPVGVLVILINRKSRTETVYKRLRPPKPKPRLRNPRLVKPDSAHM